MHITNIVRVVVCLITVIRSQDPEEEAELSEYNEEIARPADAALEQQQQEGHTETYQSAGDYEDETPIRTAPKDDYTFVALVDIVFNDLCKRTCTGAIIHDNVVITAAHCFTMVRNQYAQPELSMSFVVIGTKAMFETGYEQYLPIERVVTHPKFRGWTADLALVFTFAGMMSDKPGQIIQLAAERSFAPVDSNVTVFSWGHCNTDVKDESRERVQKKRVDVEAETPKATIVKAGQSSIEKDAFEKNQKSKNSDLILRDGSKKETYAQSNLNKKEEYPPHKPNNNEDYPLLKANNNEEYPLHKPNTNEEYPSHKPYNNEEYPLHKPTYNEEYPLQKPNNNKEYPLHKLNINDEYPLHKPSNNEEYLLHKLNNNEEYPLHKPNNNEEYPLHKPNNNEEYSLHKPNINEEYPLHKPNNNREHPLRKLNNNEEYPLHKPNNSEEYPLHKPKQKETYPLRNKNPKQQYSQLGVNHQKEGKKRIESQSRTEIKIEEFPRRTVKKREEYPKEEGQEFKAGIAENIDFREDFNARAMTSPEENPIRKMHSSTVSYDTKTTKGLINSHDGKRSYLSFGSLFGSDKEEEKYGLGMQIQKNPAQGRPQPKRRTPVPPQPRHHNHQPRPQQSQPLRAIRRQPRVFHTQPPQRPTQKRVRKSKIVEKKVPSSRRFHKSANEFPDFDHYKNWRRQIGTVQNNLTVGIFGYVNLAACKKIVERTLPPLYEIKNKNEVLCYSSEEFYITNEDSGAPVVQANRLVAVTVGGVDTEGEHVAVGMKVTCFCNWIAENLPNNSGASMKCCKNCCDPKQTRSSKQREANMNMPSVRMRGQKRQLGIHRFVEDDSEDDHNHPHHYEGIQQHHQNPEAPEDVLKNVQRIVDKKGQMISQSDVQKASVKQSEREREPKKDIPREPQRGVQRDKNQNVQHGLHKLMQKDQTNDHIDYRL